MLTLMTNSN